MNLQVVWFVLWGLLWAVYFMLDGFDLGAGFLSGILGKIPAERASIRRVLGPVWDGNEVWLLTAGGATFAAFPTTYAMMFSFLYTPLLIILFALILRGVALEFRAKGQGRLWEKTWDATLVGASFLPALLFGVAFGNIFRGLPVDAAGYHGSLASLLNPYSLLTGALFVLTFAVHGALWIALKTEGEPGGRARRLASGVWFVLAVAAAGFLAATYFATSLAANYRQRPVWLVVPVLAVGALLGIKLFLTQDRIGRAFAASCLLIVAETFTGIIGLYPNLIPSRLDPAFSLTIFNSSSSSYTLRIMTIVALVFLPAVIGYQVWVYRVFRHKVSTADIGAGQEIY